MTCSRNCREGGEEAVPPLRVLLLSSAVSFLYLLFIHVILFVLISFLAFSPFFLPFSYSAAVSSYFLSRLLDLFSIFLILLFSCFGNTLFLSFQLCSFPSFLSPPLFLCLSSRHYFSLVLLSVFSHNCEGVEVSFRSSSSSSSEGIPLTGTRGRLCREHKTTSTKANLLLWSSVGSSHPATRFLVPACEQAHCPVCLQVLAP